MDFNATLIGQTIAMIFFVWFTMKNIWPILDTAITERKEKIAQGLAASEKAERDLEEAKAVVATQLNEAKSQASELIEQAKKRHTEIVESAKGDANGEAEKILKGARAEIEQETIRAREQLRAQVGTLAIVGAERILQRELNAEAQNDIVEKLVSEL